MADVWRDERSRAFVLGEEDSVYRVGYRRCNLTDEEVFRPCPPPVPLAFDGLEQDVKNLGDKQANQLVLFLLFAASPEDHQTLNDAVALV